MATSIVSNELAADFGNSPQKTGEPVDRLSIYSGKALEFDGVSDYITFPNVYSSLNSDGDLTFAWWMNINNYAPGGTNSKLISSHPGLEITIYSDYMRVSIGNSNDYNWGGETNTWLRCVFTMDDTVGSLYVNGELKETYTHSSNFKDAKSTTGGFISKRHSTNMTHYVDGKLCDIQFWNTTWSLSDVTYDYLNPEKLITSNTSVSGSQTTSNLLVWYPMNDTGITNPQTVIFDAAGTNNTTKNHATTTFLGDDKLGGNGGFDATSNWSVVSGSVGTEWTINDSSNSKAVHNTSNANTLRYTGSSGDLVDGTTYQVDFTIADRTAGSITIAIGGAAASSSQTASGSIELTAGGSSNRIIDINPTSDFDGSIDSVTVKEIGIATGWTEADQQDTIPQTALMDGCIKTIFNEPDDNNERIDLAWGNGVNTQNYSYSSWVFPISGNGMFMTPGSVVPNQRLYMALTGGNWDLGIGSKSWETTPDSGSLPSATLNAWAHYTLVVNDTQGIVYINGTEAFRRTPTTTSFTLPADMDLMASGNSYEFGGIIDEVSIFNTALSDTQVLALYNNGQPLHATKSAAASNLVGYWRNNVLTSTGAWEDLSTNDNHGTVTGSPSGSIFFQQGATANLCTQGYSNNIVHPSKGGIHFLGQEYAAFPGERIINLDGDFTIEFWFKKTQLHVGTDLIDQMLFGSGTNQIRIPSSVSSGKMSAVYYRDAAAVGSYTLTVDSNNRKSIYEWSHVAIIRESGTVKLYIDTVTTNNTTISSTGQMQIKLIGAYSVPNGQMYKGFLDDLRVYDKALSEEEITKNYNVSKSQHKNN